MLCRICCVVLLLLCVVRVGDGSSVLVVFPMPSRSHGMLGESVAKTLLDAGHEVTFVTTLSKEMQRPGLTVVNISSVISKMSDREHLSIMQLVKNPRPPQRLLEIGATFAQRTLQHEAMQELLFNTDVKFDAVIVEWFFSGLLAPLAAVFDCPLIWYSGLDISWMTLQLMHEQSNPAYSVDIQSKRSSTFPTSVRERAYRLWQQTYLTWWMYYMTQYVEIPAYREIYKTPLELRGRMLSDYESLVYNGSLLLINSQPLVGQVLPLPANAKYVGGHHVKLPTNPLPPNLQKLLDSAKDGAILFSLGSNIKSKDLPHEMKQGLLDVFGQLEQTVIWNFEEKLFNLPKNVHILEWAPQASILNHPNTILLISHGGILSYIEATYFGVAIIGIPFFGDQFVMMDLMASRGRGIRVDFSDELPQTIKEAVNESLGNYRYRSNAKQASEIIRRNPVSPQKELLHWIELVIETQGAGHLRSPALLVPSLERLHVDIIALFLLFVWFLSKVVKLIKVHMQTPEQEEDFDKKDD